MAQLAVDKYPQRARTGPPRRPRSARPQRSRRAKGGCAPSVGPTSAASIPWKPAPHSQAVLERWWGVIDQVNALQVRRAGQYLLPKSGPHLACTALARCRVLPPSAPPPEGSRARADPAVPTRAGRPAVAVDRRQAEAECDQDCVSCSEYQVRSIEGSGGEGSACSRPAVPARGQSAGLGTTVEQGMPEIHLLDGEECSERQDQRLPRLRALSGSPKRGEAERGDAHDSQLKDGLKPEDCTNRRSTRHPSSTRSATATHR